MHRQEGDDHEDQRPLEALVFLFDLVTDDAVLAADKSGGCVSQCQYEHGRQVEPGTVGREKKDQPDCERKILGSTAGPFDAVEAS
jgi:hypothetical protein